MLESRHKGRATPLLSGGWDEARPPVRISTFVQFNALTQMAECQDGHPDCKKRIALIPEVL